MTFYHDDLTLISLIIRINIKANHTFCNVVTFPIISSENKIDPQTPFLTYTVTLKFFSLNRECHDILS